MSTNSAATSQVARPRPVSTTASRGVLVGSLATITWFLLGIESIIHPAQNNARDAWWMIPFALTAFTFVYVHALQASASGTLERIGFYAVMIASVLVFLGNVGLLTNQKVLAAFSFPWGALLWAVGLIVFGIGTWRARVLPWYSGLSMILLEPLSVLTGLVLSPIAPLHERGGYSAGVEKALAVFFVTLGIRRVLNATRNN